MSQPRTDALVQRAMILHDHRRYPDAERELRGALAQEPSHATAHAMLALCLAEQDRLSDAMAEAGVAVGLAPDDPFPHYAMGCVLLKRNRPDEAIPAINQAIALSPYNPAYFAALSAAQFDLRRWPAALEAAERGLAVDPEHDRCVNLRAMALVKLGRRDEAGTGIDSALRRDPEDALSHANLGWTLLNNGKPKEAMVHFREALRLEPGMDWARAGIVEALKAHNFIYRWILAYFFWISRLGSRVQWAVVIGGYVGVQVLRRLEAAQPQLKPVLLPIIIAYLAFAYMTWLADPIFNLMLRLNRFGRHALSRTQTVAANCTGVVLLLAIGSFVAYFTTHDAAYLLAGVLIAAMLVPVSAVFKAPEGWPRLALTGYCALLALVGTLLFFGVYHIDHAPTSPLWDAAVERLQFFFIAGVVMHGFVANALMGARVRR